MKTCIMFCLSLFWLISCKDKEALLTDVQPTIPPTNTTLTSPTATTYAPPTLTFQDLAGSYNVSYTARGQSDVSAAGVIPVPGGNAKVIVSPVDPIGKFLLVVSYPAARDSLRIIATDTTFTIQNRLYRSKGYSSQLTGMGLFKYRYIEFTTVKQVYDSTQSTIYAYKIYRTYKGYQ